MANGKGTGRQGLAYLLDLGLLLSGKVDVPPSMLKGIWYYVFAKAATSSAIPDKVDIGRAFLCSKDTPLAFAGDSVYPISKELIGFASDKSLDSSKQATDATTDVDDEADMVSDGLVTRTGSINGKRTIEAKSSATSRIKAMFAHSLYATAGVGGAVDTIEKVEISTPKQLVMIDWVARDVAEGQPIEVDIFPCIFTQLAKSSSYGAVDTLNCNFSVVASDDLGLKPTHYEGPNRLPLAV